MSAESNAMIELLDGELTTIRQRFLNGDFNLNNVKHDASANFQRDLAALLSNRTQQIRELCHLLTSEKERNHFIFVLHNKIVAIIAAGFKTLNTEQGKHLTFVHDYDYYLQSLQTLRFTVKRLEQHRFRVPPDISERRPAKTHSLRLMSAHAKAEHKAYLNDTKEISERALTRLDSMKEHYVTNEIIVKQISDIRAFLKNNQLHYEMATHPNEKNDLTFALLLFLKNKQLELLNYTQQLGEEPNKSQSMIHFFGNTASPLQLTIQRVLMIVNYEIDSLTRVMPANQVKQVEELLTRVLHALK